MSPVKRRRRLPTLINRGLGLLEVILPCGTSAGEEPVLPPGQRDSSGFWFPNGYSEPCQIFSAAQRELQENQRRIQKRRIAARAHPPILADGGSGITSPPSARADGFAARGVVASVAAPAAVAAETIAPNVDSEEVAVPLPKPLTDGVPVRANGPPAAAPPARTGIKPSPSHRSNLEGPLLPDSD